MAARPFFGFSTVCDPLGLTGRAGFWPGAVLPPGLVHVTPTAVPCASTVATSVAFPSPATSAVQFRFKPTSVQTGVPPFVKWAPGVAAVATPASANNAAETPIGI